MAFGTERELNTSKKELIMCFRRTTTKLVNLSKVDSIKNPRLNTSLYFHYKSTTSKEFSPGSSISEN